jgi:hypothetical protein
MAEPRLRNCKISGASIGTRERWCSSDLSAVAVATEQRSVRPGQQFFAMVYAYFVTWSPGAVSSWSSGESLDVSSPVSPLSCRLS